jgi:hypothetical protein
MISCSLGQQLTVTSVNTNGVNLTVTPSYTFSQQPFAVYKTTQSGLQLELSRSNTYQVGDGNCGTTVNGSTVVHQRSYNFPVLVTNQSYNEVGVGWSNSTGGNVFSRILLKSPVMVDAGFYLRLIYNLTITYTPSTPALSVASIGGWYNTNGSQSIQNFLYSYIDTSGVSQNDTAILDPYFINPNNYYYAAIFAASSTASLSTFGTSVDRSDAYVVSNQMTKAAYTNGNYYCDKTGNTITGTSLLVGSVGFGLAGGNGAIPVNNSTQAYCFVFNQSQSLLNTQTLSLTFRNAWSRILG